VPLLQGHAWEHRRYDRARLRDADSGGVPKADADGGPSSAEDEPQNKECSMRIFVAAIAALAIAAAPCAWDSDPRELPAIVALFTN
jgi:hypothetical protein